MPTHTMKMKKIWNRFSKKPYRDAFVSASIDDGIGLQLFAMRQHRNLTQANLAEKCEMKQSRISAIENSSASLSLTSLKRIASALDVALSVKFVPFSEFVTDEVNLRSDRKIEPFSQDQIEPRQYVIATRAADLVQPKTLLVNNNASQSRYTYATIN